LTDSNRRALKREHKQVVDILRPLDETKLATETVKFFVAPTTPGTPEDRVPLVSPLRSRALPRTSRFISGWLMQGAVDLRAVGERAVGLNDQR
jgi:hypothetical protein